MRRFCEHSGTVRQVISILLEHTGDKDTMKILSVFILAAFAAVHAAPFLGSDFMGEMTDLGTGIASGFGKKIHTMESKMTGQGGDGDESAGDCGDNVSGMQKKAKGFGDVPKRKNPEEEAPQYPEGENPEKYKALECAKKLKDLEKNEAFKHKMEKEFGDFTKFLKELYHIKISLEKGEIEKVQHKLGPFSKKMKKMKELLADESLQDKCPDEDLESLSKQCGKCAKLMEELAKKKGKGDNDNEGKDGIDHHGKKGKDAKGDDDWDDADIGKDTKGDDNDNDHHGKKGKGAKGDDDCDDTDNGKDNSDHDGKKGKNTNGDDDGNDHHGKKGKKAKGDDDSDDTDNGKDNSDKHGKKGKNTNGDDDDNDHHGKKGKKAKGDDDCDDTDNGKDNSDQHGKKGKKGDDGNDHHGKKGKKAKGDDDCDDTDNGKDNSDHDGKKGKNTNGDDDGNDHHGKKGKKAKGDDDCDDTDNRKDNSDQHGKKGKKGDDSATEEDGKHKHAKKGKDGKKESSDDDQSLALP